MSIEDDSFALVMMATSLDDISKLRSAQVNSQREFEHHQTQLWASFVDKRKTLPEHDPILVKMTAALECYDKRHAINTEYIAWLDDHMAAFKKGYADRKWNPEDLEQYVADNATIYMDTITDFNSRLYMSVKPIDPEAGENLIKSVLREAKDPYFAARVARWDTDLARAGIGSGFKPTGDNSAKGHDAEGEKVADSPAYESIEDTVPG
ncbi:hypothetical protein P153DRAFT_381241 [Dothidotthia symphoricarpi CBS 119687]|uniref:Uncharacterized protein n=1 Tax=Dothidotthia symphoricarpi CBS 119687 TaxID=1392245 RepID=A0A6A6AQ69_9PLEO|nr:uncharacterized protein P153DRAFT_381241 [Dothidotthia symphoricarpi CBS 119687]KAF2134069.1 hypothetical protein P153DRAFT_381241 [Dothidotthia symphoricarpi CBS 119687]